MAETKPADKNGNADRMKGLECPECGQHESLVVQVVAMFTVSDDAEKETGDSGYDRDSFTKCPNCSFVGRLKQFQIAE